MKVCLHQKATFSPRNGLAVPCPSTYESLSTSKGRVLTYDELVCVLPHEVAIRIVDVSEQLLIVPDGVVAMLCDDEDFSGVPEA